MNKDYYCVIMGGGVGSRFWPMSRADKPKQFLDFFGSGRSLLRMTFDRFAKFIPKENIYIVTGEQYAGEVLRHLPELTMEQLLLEPMRRNTAPCIAYASYRIASRNPAARVVVSPSDHLILDEVAFEESVLQALEHSENSRLITLGVRATRPDTGYGYIQMGEAEGDGFYKVKTFTEKPDLNMAKVFVDSGEFLWNSGMFVWGVREVLQGFQQHLPELAQIMQEGQQFFGTPEESGFIQTCYAECPSISIDYGLMEKADNVCVLPVSFGWADLGTWGSLYELSEKDAEANVTIGTRALYYESTGNIVSSSDPKRLIVLQGVHDAVVSESDGVILICKRSEEQRVKHFVHDVDLLFGKEYE